MEPHISRRFPFELLERQQHYRYRNLADLALHSILRFDGRIDHELLTRAIRLWVDVHPLFGCSVEEGIWALDFVRRDDLDHVAWCDVIEVPAEEVEAELHRFFLLPCRPWLGELAVRARVIRGTRDDVLCFKSNHALSDAVGLKETLYTLATIYGKLQDDPSYRPAPQVGFRRDLAQIVDGLSLLQKLAVVRRAWRDKRAMKEPARIVGMPLVLGDPGTRRYVLHSVPAERFAHLKAYARQRGASFNDLMNALFGFALLHVIGGGRAAPLRLLNPVDLRRYNPSCARVEGLRNLSSFAIFNVQPEEGYTFDSLLALCSEQSRQLRDDCPGLGVYPKMRLRNLLPNRLLTAELDARWAKVLQWARAGGKADLPLVVSNAGVFDEHRCVFQGSTLRDVSIMPFVYYNQCFFTFATFRNQVTISVGFCDPATIEPLVAGLLGIIDEQIARICDTAVASSPG